MKEKKKKKKQGKPYGREGELSPTRRRSRERKTFDKKCGVSWKTWNQQLKGLDHFKIQKQKREIRWIWGQLSPTSLHLLDKFLKRHALKKKKKGSFWPWEFIWSAQREVSDVPLFTQSFRKESQISLCVVHNSSTSFFCLNCFCHKKTRKRYLGEEVEDRVIKCHVSIQEYYNSKKSSREYWPMSKILGTPNGTRDTLRKGRKVRENI